MKYTTSFFLACLLFFAVILGFMPRDSGAMPPIVVATEAAYPPFALLKKNGALTGFEVELIQALCLHQNMQCQLTNQPFDTLIPGLMAKKFQVVIGAIAATPERAQKILFSDIYYQPHPAFLTKEDFHFPTSPKAWSDVTIGTQRGSTFEQFLHLQAIDVNLSLYATFEDAFLDLQAERIQAVMADKPILQDFIKRNKGKYVLRDNPWKDASDLHIGFALGFRPDKEGRMLRDSFNKGLASLQKDGTYDKLCRKWL